MLSDLSMPAESDNNYLLLSTEKPSDLGSKWGAGSDKSLQAVFASAHMQAKR